MINWLKKLFSTSPPHTESESDPQKYLIAGLGNFGEEYEHTRHNIGFDVIDLLAKENNLTFEEKGHALFTTLKSESCTFVLIKPTTFMNLSGKAISYWMKKEKIEIDNVLVVIDDLNIQFGRLRLRGKGSDGGHNGLKHINATLGTKNYARLRFGIGSEFGKGQQIEYVLGEWSEEEKKTLPELLEKASEAIKAFGKIGLNNAMSKFNN